MHVASESPAQSRAQLRQETRLEPIREIFFSFFGAKALLPKDLSITKIASIVMKNINADI